MVSEDNGTGRIGVTLNGQRCGDVTLSVVVTGGDATSLIDFVVPNASPFEDATSSIAFDVVNDGDVEGEESFSVAIVDVSGAVVGTASTHTVTIRDDDFTPLTLPQACAPLGALGAREIAVSPADAPNLGALVAGALPGDAFVFASGLYVLDESNTMVIRRNGVVVRSASGRAADVILDHGALDTGPVFDVRADNVTIADLSIKNIGVGGAVRFRDADRSVRNTTLYNVTFTQPHGNVIQTPPGPAYADNGMVACSRFVLDDEHRDALELAGECTFAVRAVALNAARNWSIIGNAFSGFWCSAALELVTVQATLNTRDLRVERNTFVDNFISMRFGLAEFRPADVRTYGDEVATCGSSYVDVIGVVALANSVYSRVAPLDTGLAVWNGCNVDVAHNTVAALSTPLSSGIEYRYATSSGARLVNNLVSLSSGVAYRQREGAPLSLSAGNASGPPATHFVDPTAGDLRLIAISSAVNGGDATAAPELVTADIEGVSRDALPDAGAYEYVP